MIRLQNENSSYKKVGIFQIMVQRLEDLLNKQVGVIIAMGAKGPVKISGTVIDVNDESGMITLSMKSGGMIGGKKQKTMVFFAYSILGLEIEEA